jgi:hypothetical protein
MTFPQITAEAAVANDRFRIDNVNALAWFGNKLDQKMHAIAALDAQYRAMRAELERNLENFEGRFMVEAEDYVRSHCERTGDRSLKTLGGLFGYRLVRGGPRVEDRLATTTWAKEHLPAAVAVLTTEKLDVSKVKDFMAATGEVVPGAAFVEDTDQFYYRPPTQKHSAGEDNSATFEETP